jgi:hypothetical protein
MPKLEDVQQELACELRAAGMTCEAAYGEAKFAAGNNNAARFFRKPHIRVRVEELRAERAARAEHDGSLARQFTFTKPVRRHVEEMASCGMAPEDIVLALGCTQAELAQHCGAELVAGRAKRRGEVIKLLYRAARAGNVSAQKKLEDMTGVAGAAASFDEAERPVRLGKKGEAQLAADAIGAGMDEEWGGDLATLN